MGRVRLKSNRAAFSISAARDGGAKPSELAAIPTRDRISGFEIGTLRVRTLGSEIWRVGTSLGVEEERQLVATEIRGLEEAIIMFAMAATQRPF